MLVKNRKNESVLDNLNELLMCLSSGPMKYSVIVSRYGKNIFETAIDSEFIYITRNMYDSRDVEYSLTQKGKKYVG